MEFVLRRARGGEAATLLRSERRALLRGRWGLRPPRPRESGLRL